MTSKPDNDANHQLDHVFMALADPTRRQLVRMLAESDHTVSQLAAPFDMSLAAVSKHIKVLQRAGVVSRHVDGRVHTLSLRPEALTGALDWITIYRNFWHSRLAALDDLFNPGEDPAKPGEKDVRTDDQ